MKLLVVALEHKYYLYNFTEGNEISKFTINFHPFLRYEKSEGSFFPLTKQAFIIRFTILSA